ncbi:beta-1,4-N-acetylgalactosaminyltransferase bre-4 [Octopus sinensis]|uniref:Beta-1,4-N-acetylgalactosaminyltransferase bre-4 n=1 Tax=Octopus sinensis TaxID=2607531 RepID=A0A6P7SB37_9MOLL|nr:beta-1,4-N-acetylgalactosaminyltransferase bre-4 [Octopus sinensis]
MLVNFNLTGEIKVNNIKLMNPALRSGGSWKPAHCISRHRVAIIIPYRDRHQHLLTLLYHLLPMLRRQQLDFRIFVVEQQGNETFNKGRIMNAAFKEALKLFTFHCCIFHDVDLIPEDDRNMYSCPEFPRHLSVAIDEMEYRLAYSILVGGVLNFKVEHFQMVNGYSNLYWGWGAEDDDMAYRILNKRLKIIRPPAGVARYKMVRHQKRKPASWAKRSKLLRTGRKRAKFDGLNNVKYKLIFSHEDALFTHFMVDIGPAPKMI